MKQKAFIFSIFLLTIFACKEEPAPIPVAIIEAYALPSAVSYGGNTTLYWKSTNVTSVTKDGIPLSATSGSKELSNLFKNTSVTLNFKGVDGQLTEKTVLILVSPAPVVEAYALPSTVQYGNSTILYWSSINVASVTKNGIPLSSTSGSESTTSLVKDTTFTFEFKGIDGKILTKSVTIDIVTKPVPTEMDLIREKFCSKYYVLIEMKNFYNGIWHYYILDEEQLRIQTYYNIDGTTFWVDPLDNIKHKLDNHVLTKDSIKIGSARYQYTLTDSTIVCSTDNGTFITTSKAFAK